MLDRPLFTVLCFYAAVAIGGCEAAPPASQPLAPSQPSSQPSTSTTVQWRLELLNYTQVSFGVRILLDGEEVYQHAPATKGHHVVELERPYVPGVHRVEFEILAATQSPSIYKAAWTVHAIPAGPFFHADGVPTSLAVGERLTLNVPI